MKQEIAFAGPGGVVLGACAELAVPDPTVSRLEAGIVSVSVRVGEIVTERLGCNAVEDEVALIVAVAVDVLERHRGVDCGVDPMAGRWALLSRRIPHDCISRVLKC